MAAYNREGCSHMAYEMERHPLLEGEPIHIDESRSRQQRRGTRYNLNKVVASGPFVAGISIRTATTTAAGAVSTGQGNEVTVVFGGGSLPAPHDTAGTNSEHYAEVRRNWVDSLRAALGVLISSAMITSPCSWLSLERCVLTKCLHWLVFMDGMQNSVMTIGLVDGHRSSMPRGLQRC